MVIEFNKTYFLLFVTILILEIFIEKTTGFIRYTLGDFFAVILVYAFIKSFIKISYIFAGLVALGIAFFIEFLQFLDISKYYPENYKFVLQIIIGTSFSFKDLLAYSLGTAITIFIEYFIENKSLKT